MKMKKLAKNLQEQFEKAKALKCFGGLVELVNNDPDVMAQDLYTKEFCCANCDSYQYCCKLADTLA